MPPGFSLGLDDGRHHSLLITRISPVKAVVLMWRAWTPSVTYPYPPLLRKPIFRGLLGSLMSTTRTPPVWHLAPQLPRYAYHFPSLEDCNAETSEMSPSKLERSSLPTKSTFSEDPGRWPTD